MERGESILVVDDEPRLLASLREVLEVVGYRVLTASDGIEALAVLQSQPVDLILADVTMPRMNGYQLYERVRENPQWVAIPFIFLTARALDSDIRYGKELGADDYLTKPIEPEDMFAAIRGRLRRARQLARPSAHRALPPVPGPRPLVVGRLRIAPDQYRAWLDGDPIKLSARGFILLGYLAQRVNQVVSPQELVRATHGLDASYAEAGVLLRPLIRSLRRRLGYPVGEAGCIENVRGVGYRLIPPED